MTGTANRRHPSSADPEVRGTHCEVSFCAMPAVRADSSVPLLCVVHLRAAWEFGNKVLADADLDAAAELTEASAGEDEDMRRSGRFDQRRGFVYFVERGGLIKVGWTGNPARRFGNLMPDRVLLVLRGTMQDEHRVHAAFASAHQMGEWFRPTADLLGFIDGLSDTPDAVDEWRSL